MYLFDVRYHKYEVPALILLSPHFFVLRSRTLIIQYNAMASETHLRNALVLDL